MDKKTVVIVGASGYGNVGDDSYRLMFKKHLSRDYHIKVFNSDLPAKLPPCHAVIMGGGGLLYAHEEHFKKMTWYLDRALEKNIPYAMISVGFQFKPQGKGRWIKKPVRRWAKHVKHARIMTVRSEADLEFARQLGREERTSYFPDLCYGIAELVRGDPVKNPERRICVVPGAGLFQHSTASSPYVWSQQHVVMDFIEALRKLGYEGIDIVRMGAGSADNAKIDLARKYLKRFPLSVYSSGDPIECFKRIAASNLVISGRFHGMVFARAADVPVITMPAAPYKIFVEDKELDVSGYAGHVKAMKDFLKEV